MDVSCVSPALWPRLMALGTAVPGSSQDGLRELVGLIGGAPTLGSLATLRSIRLTRLSTEPLSHFRLLNHMASVVVYPIDGSGQAQPTGISRGSLDIVQSVCIVELTQGLMRGESA